MLQLGAYAIISVLIASFIFVPNVFGMFTSDIRYMNLKFDFLYTIPYIIKDICLIMCQYQ
jgi:ABC-type uncharacterized transport system permease subunit